MKNTCYLLSAILVGVFLSAASALDQKAIIDAVSKAHESSTPLDPLSHSFGQYSIDQAYTIQKVAAGAIAKHAGPVIGYKIAYASRAAQEQFNMSEPARGPIHLIQRVPSGAALPARTWSSIMLETEIIFTIGMRIDKPIKSVEELKPYVKWIHTGFDAGNFPYKTDKAKPVPADMIASGTGARIFVFGKPLDPTSVDLSALSTTLFRNGEKIREAHARDIMGDPWKALLWCANHLVDDGLTLEPGMFVFSGTAAPAYKAAGDDIKGEYRGACGMLGEVTMTIE